MFLSVIIPAYNEAERLPVTLIDIDKQLAQADFDYEILVVNDGSSDNTHKVVAYFLPLVKNLRLINSEANEGKGAAVRKGMLAAEGKLRLFMDADNSTAIAEFSKMRPYFNEGYDIVIGSRAVSGAKLQPPQPLYKQLAGKLGNLLIQLWALTGIWDSQCGFKCFTASAAEEIFSKTRINGWAFDVEALALARKIGFKIKEMPVLWVNHPDSRVRLSSYLQALRDVLKIRV